MKKIISLLLTFAVLASCMVYACAADSMPALLFDMDLSDCSESSIVVKDESSSGKVQSIAYGNTSDAPAPGYGVNEYGTPYLIFDTNTEGGVDAMNSSVNVHFSDGTIPDKNAITYTAWVYEFNGATTARKNKSLCSFGDETSSKRDYVLQHTNDSSLQLQISNLAGYTTVVASNTANYKKKWTHFAVTIQWTQTDSENNLWACDWVCYVNGVKTGGTSKTGLTKNNYNTIYSEAVLTIGSDSSKDANRSFPGYIADFKLYDGVLSANNVMEEYLESGAGYLPTVNASHSLAELTREDESFTVSFDGEINKETLEKGVVLTSADETEVNTKYKGYDETTKTATFLVLDYLEPGATYTLNVAGVKDPNGFGMSQKELSFIAKNEEKEIISLPTVVYKDKDGKTVSKENAQSAEISTEVTNNSAESLSFFLSLIIKDKNGRAEKMPISSPLKLSQGAKDTLKLTASGLIPDGTSAVMIWCVTEDGRFYPLKIPELLP